MGKWTDHFYDLEFLSKLPVSSDQGHKLSKIKELFYIGQESFIDLTFWDQQYYTMTVQCSITGVFRSKINRGAPVPSPWLLCLYVYLTTAMEHKHIYIHLYHIYSFGLYNTPSLINCHYALCLPDNIFVPWGTYGLLYLARWLFGIAD